MSIPNSPSSRPSLSAPEVSPPAPQLDVLMVRSPGLDDPCPASLRRKFEQQGMLVGNYGDGKHEVRSKILRQTIENQLGPDGHVVLLAHGGILKERHHMQLGNHKYGMPPSASIVRWVCEGKKNSHRFAHIVACKAGELTSQLKPGTPEWKAGHVMLYAGKEILSPESCVSSLQTALSYLALCKEKGSDVDPLKMFALAGLARAESITLLGGDLKEPLTLAAPQASRDLKNQDFLASLVGSKKDQKRLAATLDALSNDELRLLPEERQLSHNFLFTCVQHNDATRIEEVLIRHPELVNLAGQDGQLLLATAASLDMQEAVKALIVHGADLDQLEDDCISALMLAADKGHIQTVRLLLDAGATAGLANEYGDTARQFAEESGHVKVAKLLKRCEEQE